MRILFVLENYYPAVGGVETLFKNLVKGLVKQGHEVTVLTHRLPGTVWAENRDGGLIWRVNCFDSRYWFSFLAIRKALQFAKHADIIHTTTYNGALPAWIAGLLRRKPVVITIHEILGKQWQKLGSMSWFKAKLHQLLEWSIVKLPSVVLRPFNRYICVSESTRKSLLQLKNTKNAVVIHNGVDYDFFNPKKYDRKKIRKKLGIEKNFVYLFFGRSGVSKGLEYIIKAVPKIKQKIPKAKFVAIVPRSKAEVARFRYIASLAEELGIRDDIIFLDAVPRQELPAYIKAADCVIVPSLTEGFGFSAAEACAMGKPVIATDNTSLPEVVSGKFMLIPPKSSEHITQAAIDMYHKKYTKTKQKKFLWKDTITKHINLYNELHG